MLYTQRIGVLRTKGVNLVLSPACSSLCQRQTWSTDVRPHAQEKARQLREAAVSRPFKWPNPGWANPSWPSPREIQIPKFDLEPDIEEGGAIAEAVRADSLGFGFSAGGMLFPYYIGVLEGLKGLGLATGIQHCFIWTNISRLLTHHFCECHCRRPHGRGVTHGFYESVPWSS